LRKGIYMLLITLIILLTGCGSSKVENTSQNTTDKPDVFKESDVCLNIMTTDKALYYMLKDIVGNKHNVDYMFNKREDELIFSFTEDSLNNISKQDLFIYAGAEFEPWMNKFLDALNKNKVGAINVSRGVKLLPYSTEIKFNDVILKDNPFYWSSIDNYKIVLLNIKNAVEDKDPKNRDYYEENFSRTIKAAEGYSKNLKDAAEGLKDYIVIVDEDELDYLLKYLGIKAVKINTDDKGTALFNTSKEENDKFIAKLKEGKNKVFFYDSDAIAEKNVNLINEYSLKPVKLKIYDDNMKFTDILTFDVDALKNISN
jgi:zinc/manganese transport system substrate-binding protein